jgi:hypothetical protein
VLRHPTVIATIILSVGMIASSLLMCVVIHSLDATLESKPMVGTGSRMAFPSYLTLGNGNSSFDIKVRSTPDQPLIVKQVP